MRERESHSNIDLGRDWPRLETGDYTHCVQTSDQIYCQDTVCGNLGDNDNGRHIDLIHPSS